MKHYVRYLLRSRFEPGEHLPSPATWNTRVLSRRFGMRRNFGYSPPFKKRVLPVVTLGAQHKVGNFQASELPSYYLTKNTLNLHRFL